MIFKMTANSSRSKQSQVDQCPRSENELQNA
jgi:hypothetical protein